jgi:TonB family protein
MGRFLIISAVLHGLLLVVAPLIPRLTGETPTAMEVYSVELLDLPASAQPVPEPTTVSPEPVQTKVEEPPDDAIAEQPRKVPAKTAVKAPPRPEKSLAERLGDRLKAEDEKRATEPQPTQAAPRAATGARPASGGTPGRTSIKVSRFPYAWYISIIQGKVSSNWKQPSDRLVSEEALSVRVSFRISRDGSVDAITVRESSGRSTIDQSAAKAVRSSAPFPPLPDDYRDDRLDVTIDFTVERE